jgi:hypothetical protein
MVTMIVVREKRRIKTMKSQDEKRKFTLRGRILEALKQHPMTACNKIIHAKNIVLDSNPAASGGPVCQTQPSVRLAKVPLRADQAVRPIRSAGPPYCAAATDPPCDRA